MTTSIIFIIFIYFWDNGIEKIIKKMLSKQNLKLFSQNTPSMDLLLR